MFVHKKNQHFKNYLHPQKPPPGIIKFIIRSFENKIENFHQQYYSLSKRIEGAIHTYPLKFCCKGAFSKNQIRSFPMRLYPKFAQFEFFLHILLI